MAMIYINRGEGDGDGIGAGFCDANGVGDGIQCDMFNFDEFNEDEFSGFSHGFADGWGDEDSESEIGRDFLFDGDGEGDGSADGWGDEDSDGIGGYE